MIEVRKRLFVAINDFFRLENDSEDYADRIFDYLDETCTQQSPSIEINQMKHSSPSIHPSDNEIPPLLCTFCPYLTRNFSEFQTHIAKHTEKNFRCLLCNCM